MNRRDFWMGFVAGLFAAALVNVFTVIAVRAEHIETRPAGDGCNTCTKQGPGSWTCTLLACLDVAEIADWERKKAMHDKEGCPPVCPKSEPEQTFTFIASTVIEDCNRKMEAAMRAMEPYLFMPYKMVKKGDQFEMESETQKSYVLWLNVKHECWRTP